MTSSTSTAISSGRYRTASTSIAPDYQGFGNSYTPDPGDYAYTFDHLAPVIR
jgi:hypothetical protein